MDSWVSGLNHQFAKLTFPENGNHRFESYIFRNGSLTLIGKGAVLKTASNRNRCIGSSPITSAMIIWSNGYDAALSMQ